jgi:hypothetical protein
VLLKGFDGSRSTTSADAAFFTRTLIAAELADSRLVELHVRDLPPVYRDSALVRLRQPAPLPRRISWMVCVSEPSRWSCWLCYNACHPGKSSPQRHRDTVL